MSEVHGHGLEAGGGGAAADRLGGERAQTPATAYLSGLQALVHLPLLQRRRDAAAGRDTAGFVSGYRGSPLSGVDQALWQAEEQLRAHNVRFQPGLNEDLAATAVWGTQQVGLFPGARHEGVFALWYAKGPGVDRSMDVLKHANAAGTAPWGGVLAVAGDDHGAKSSTLPHQSEHMFAAAMIPTLSPAGVQDYLDLGLHGWAMSRYSGCWVALKATADTVESSAAISLDPFRVVVRHPDDFEMPPGGLNIRWPDPPLEQELRLQRYKVYAAMAYARANGLNRVVLDSPRARFGIITTGKAYLDVRQALDDLGIDARAAAEIGLRLFKVGMNWPLDAEGVHAFALGLEEILVVEEKRQLIEYQLKEQLYNWREDVRPRVIGKYDDKGEWELPVHDWQLPAAGELNPATIARVIARRVARFHASARIAERIAFLDAQERALARPHAVVPRAPHYCSGCPHNTSTMSLPEGSRALAGIGCHYMAVWLSADTTQTFGQMGGEGAAWVGQAPFTETTHVFANLGDGTYQHSGLLAIRQAVAAGVNITYKILYNDAVAMTGGQRAEGAPGVPRITRQLRAEGVERVVVVTDDPGRYAGVTDLAPGVTVHHRRELDAVQRDLRASPGVSALVYDQTCAAEKRRRRKAGEMPDPPRRAFVNERVCEGCGDCSRTSNCLSVVPVETEFGRKRAVDQSSCNKDFSCVEGFCPSWVTVEGGRPRKGVATGAAAWDGPPLPDPVRPELDVPYGILVTGVGGTGVVTIGTLLGLAATLEGRGVTVLDMAGLAQKGGPVWSHVRLSPRQESLHAPRIAAGEADAVIGCDLVVTAADESLARMRAGLTRAVVNTDVAPTSDMVRALAAQARTGDLAAHPDPRFPVDAMERQIVDAAGPGRASFLPATGLATALLGDAIATNLFLLGYAYQGGLVPLSEASLMAAIEANGVAVAASRAAFLWGRRAAHDPEAVRRAAFPAPAGPAPARTLDEVIARRAEDLTAYQDAAYASRYRALVEAVRAAERRVAPGSEALGAAVARAYHKLLAYKDEYEVARLYTDGTFARAVDAAFEGDVRLVVHLAPPLLARPDPATGRPRKRAFGPWMFRAFQGLARLKALRGTPLDPFGYTEERRLERRLIAEYERLVAEVIEGLHPGNLDAAAALLAWPEQVRGFGPVKRQHLAEARRREARLREQFHRPPEPATAEDARERRESALAE